MPFKENANLDMPFWEMPMDKQTRKNITQQAGKKKEKIRKIALHIAYETPVQTKQYDNRHACDLHNCAFSHCCVCRSNLVIDQFIYFKYITNNDDQLHKIIFSSYHIYIRFKRKIQKGNSNNKVQLYKYNQASL